MKSRNTRQFREMFATLLAHVRNQAREAYRLFRDNPQHPGLHFQKVFDDPVIFSAPVGISYRAAAALDGDSLIWFWIGSHGEYDKLLAHF
jgi:hypothetical protein